jgi:hypothetical protein
MVPMNVAQNMEQTNSSQGTEPRYNGTIELGSCGAIKVENASLAFAAGLTQLMAALNEAAEPSQPTTSEGGWNRQTICEAIRGVAVHLPREDQVRDQLFSLTGCIMKNKPWGGYQGASAQDEQQTQRTRTRDQIAQYALGELKACVTNYAPNDQRLQNALNILQLAMDSSQEEEQQTQTTGSRKSNRRQGQPVS